MQAKYWRCVERGRLVSVNTMNYFVAVGHNRLTGSSVRSINCLQYSLSGGTFDLGGYLSLASFLWHIHTMSTEPSSKLPRPAFSISIISLCLVVLPGSVAKKMTPRSSFATRGGIKN